MKGSVWAATPSERFLKSSANFWYGGVHSVEDPHVLWLGRTGQPAVNSFRAGLRDLYRIAPLFNHVEDGSTV